MCIYNIYIYIYIFKYTAYSLYPSFISSRDGTFFPEVCGNPSIGVGCLGP